MARVITFTSASAGVGKTSICANLAAQLARRGQRVCLLDADGGDVNSSALLGLEARHTLKDLIVYGMPLDCVLIRHHRGFDVLPGSADPDWMETLTSPRLEHLAASLRQLDAYDFVLIDGPVVTAPHALSLTQTSPEIILVITPSPISAPDAYSLLKLLSSEHPTKRIQVIVNKANNHILGRHSYGSYRDVARRHMGIQIALLGLVGVDTQRHSMLSGQTAADGGWSSTTTGDIGKLAEQLLAEKTVRSVHNMQRFCDRYLKLLAADVAAGSGEAEVFELPASRKQRLQRELEYLSNQVEDLIREVERLRQAREAAPRTLPAAPLTETHIAALANESQAVTLQGETFSIYSMHSTPGGRQYFAWHSAEDTPESSGPDGP